MKTFADVKTKDDYISLSKIIDQPIKDVIGYISYEFDEPVFKLCKVELENGKTIFCEGEHDHPYLAYGEDVGLTDEVMENIYKTDPDNAEEDSES